MEMIFSILFVLLLVGAAAIFADTVDASRKNKGKNIDGAGKISFRETMDLVDLPIITFLVGDKKCNFILDTGASYSLIDSTVLGTIEHERLNIEGTVYGINGKEQDAGFAKIVLKYKGVNYSDEFQIVDLSSAFTMLKEEHGVNLHGMLGSSFFQKYKYVIDFDELVAYAVV